MTTRYALGKRDPKRAPALAFADFNTSQVALPAYTPTDAAPGLDYPMDENDSWGDCVVAGWDHFLQVVQTLLVGSYTNLTDAQILALYQTQNPGFDPNGSADTNGPGSQDDGGMDIQSFLEYLVKQGLILGFAKVDYTNAAELRDAIYCFEGIITGVQLQNAQQDQFESGTWDYVAGGSIDGGHCIPLVGYDPDEATCVSWAALVKCTNSFVTHLMDEAWVIVTQAHVDHPGFRDNFDLAGFAAAYQEITGATFPVPVTPDPTPTPEPVPVPPTPEPVPVPVPPVTPPAPVPPAPPAPPAPVPPAPTPTPTPTPTPAVDDADLAEALTEWLSHRHTSEVNRTLAKVAAPWLTDYYAWLVQALLEGAISDDPNEGPQEG